MQVHKVISISKGFIANQVPPDKAVDFVDFLLDFVDFTACLTDRQVKHLEEESNRLKDIHPDQQDDITSKQAEILNSWTRLANKVRASLAHKPHLLYFNHYGINYFSI